ncbi:MAG TPA: MotA/TolQ/ExbB proton channel family protein [Verrucomicrobiae bacterium]|nr:MotA/TolQ/ExbB proton channel family protein [Verrucomicrobiae bacterium]
MSLLKSFVLATALCAACSIQAQDLDAVASGASVDLQKAVAELGSVREQIESERLPLARQLTDLEQRLINRKAELAKAQRFQDNQLVELNALKADARRQADEVKFIESLVTEYSKAFRSRIHFVEEPRYKELLDSTDAAAAQSDLGAPEKFARRSQLLTAALQRAQAAQGGDSFEGKALDKQGLVQSGKVVVFGPVAMFACTSTAGLLQQEVNKSDPTVAQLEPDLVAASRKLVADGSGELVFDPTLGNAFKLSAMHTSFYDKLAEGGLVMIPLLALGAGSLLLAILKWIQFSRVRLASERDLQTVLAHIRNEKPDMALHHARSIPGIAGDLLATAVRYVDEKKEYIEEILYERMLAARTRLERGLPFLALTATTGPLLGLLGTVTGMIATFKLISSFGSGDPKMLAAGISEALVATATGMAVAIPALLLHAFLSRKAKTILGSMEQTAVGFVNGVPQEDKQTFA